MEPAGSGRLGRAAGRGVPPSPHPRRLVRGTRGRSAAGEHGAVTSCDQHTCVCTSAWRARARRAGRYAAAVSSTRVRVPCHAAHASSAVRPRAHHAGHPRARVCARVHARLGCGTACSCACSYTCARGCARGCALCAQHCTPARTACMGTRAHLAVLCGCVPACRTVLAWVCMHVRVHACVCSCAVCTHHTVCTCISAVCVHARTVPCTHAAVLCVHTLRCGCTCWTHAHLALLRVHVPCSGPGCALGRALCAQGRGLGVPGRCRGAGGQGGGGAHP